MPATAALPRIQSVRVFASGEYMESRSTRRGPVFNPSTGEQIAEVPFCTAAEVDAVVRAAHDAFPKWRDTPVVERARVMFRLVALLEKNADNLARTISLEHGKTHAESVGSVRRGIEMVEFACSIPTLSMGDTVHNLAQDVDCETFHYPLGVCAGITPFNFPFMVPLWMFPIAITCGNTFVLKPSEKVPHSAMRLAELLVEAGLPPGVFNVVHGDKEAVDALLTHPLVQAVSFVGSTPIAKYIWETGTKHGKRVQANGGAKNHILIMPDADIEKSVAALQSSAFGCSGQRCMAGSLAIAVGKAADPVVKTLVANADRMTVGRTDRPHEVDMGPVVTRQHLDGILANIEKGAKEGAKLARDGRSIKVADAPNGFYLGPTIFDHVSPEMHAAKCELFGPVLSVSRVATLDEAIEQTNKSPFGNGAVIYTRDGHAAREFKHRAGAGMIGINVGVPAPMAMFPFTGAKASFFGDLHMQGKEGIAFYTQQRMIMSRWQPGGAGGEFVTTRG
ncbi:MAG TPA: CoA-acylating methylmalonate-semialdehyde dehydrogenase [Phycisphaerae bacterium]|nr:CoA-acylating methylmalonate-semialdehyde dehydrogenase [Phycisphaerae bacterium]